MPDGVLSTVQIEGVPIIMCRLTHPAGHGRDVAWGDKTHATVPIANRSARLAGGTSARADVTVRAVVRPDLCKARGFSDRVSEPGDLGLAATSTSRLLMAWGRSGVATKAK
jgi:hypothetical protein